MCQFIVFLTVACTAVSARSQETKPLAQTDGIAQIGTPSVDVEMVGKAVTDRLERRRIHCLDPDKEFRREMNCFICPFSNSTK